MNIFYNNTIYLFKYNMKSLAYKEASYSRISGSHHSEDGSSPCIKLKNLINGCIIL